MLTKANCSPKPPPVPFALPSDHGVKRFGSRGNIDDLRMLGKARKSITTRSRPAEIQSRNVGGGGMRILRV
eukprot:scaffold119714_cov32-Tisochrysis_lutea.AAC.2